MLLPRTSWQHHHKPLEHSFKETVDKFTDLLKLTMKFKLCVNFVRLFYTVTCILLLFKRDNCFFFFYKWLTYHLLFFSLSIKTKIPLLLNIFTYPLLQPCLCLFSLIFHKGFLQITPEGSPQAQRKGEVGGEAEVSGLFCLHTSGLDFTTQEMSEDRQVSSTSEGTVTTVTKTTRITRQMLTTDPQTGEPSTTVTTTHQLSDFKCWGCCSDIFLLSFHFVVFLWRGCSVLVN